MGREVLQIPDVLVVSQPTWGVDAGAAAAIHQALVDLAAARLGDRRHQPGPRRAPGDLRHARRDQRGPAVADDDGRRGLDRGDRPPDGRRSRRARRGRRRRLPPSSAGRPSMLFELEKRKEPSRAMVYLTPVIAVALTMLVGAAVFSLVGYDGPRGGLGHLPRPAHRPRQLARPRHQGGAARSSSPSASRSASAPTSGTSAPRASTSSAPSPAPGSRSPPGRRPAPGSCR